MRRAVSSASAAAAAAAAAAQPSSLRLRASVTGCASAAAASAASPSAVAAAAAHHRRIAMMAMSTSSISAAPPPPSSSSDGSDDKKEKEEGNAPPRVPRGRGWEGLPMPFEAQRTATTAFLWDERRRQMAADWHASRRGGGASSSSSSSSAAEEEEAEAAVAEPIDKTPADSAVQVLMPFGSDPVLRDQYTSPFGHLRIGRLLEDIDACAGNVAYRHADDGRPETRPLTIVTASVDRITLEGPPGADRQRDTGGNDAMKLQTDAEENALLEAGLSGARGVLDPTVDLRLDGRVTHVGRSSMEVRVTLSREVPPARRIRLLHNPKCSKSRAALALLQQPRAPEIDAAAGGPLELDVVDILATPPTRAEILEICEQLRMLPQELVRRGPELRGALAECVIDRASPAAEGTAAAEEADPADTMGEDAALAVLTKRPEFLQRPIGIADGGATGALIARPPEEILELRDGAEARPVLISTLTMVARDAITNKAAPVNRLIPQTEQEHALFEQGERSKQRRLADRQKSLETTAPTHEEAKLIHRIFLAAARQEAAQHGQDGTEAPRPRKEFVPMNTTNNATLHLCQPGQRNIHGKIFGGFLMRKAFELSHVSAALFWRSKTAQPRFVALDDIAFHRPVEIGNILKLESAVVYSKGSMAQVEVTAYVVDPAVGNPLKTNVFFFTYSAPVDAMRKAVVPESYSESLRFIAGKRRHDAREEERREQNK